MVWEITARASAGIVARQRTARRGGGQTVPTCPNVERAAGMLPYSSGVCSLRNQSMHEVQARL
jgi:hypothetical protein